MTTRAGRTIMAALCGRYLPEPRGLRGEALFRAACEHGLAGLLSDAVASLGTRCGPVLRSVAGDLKLVSTAQRALVETRMTAARELASHFREGRVPVAFAKGVALLVRVYAPGQRFFGDLDLLVSREDVRRARAVLLAAGYAFAEDSPRSTMEETYLREAGPGPVQVDFHWEFASRDGLQAAVRVPVAEIVGRARDVDGVPVPCMEDNLLLAAANLVRSRVDRLILIVDFARMAAQDVDWGVVVQRARAWRLRVALWLGLRLAVDLLDARVPPPALRALRPPWWRRTWILAALQGSALWKRDKFGSPYLAWVLPTLCLDSWGDIAQSVMASRHRIMGRLLRVAEA
jgi:hypothetical protein